MAILTREEAHERKRQKRFGRPSMEPDYTPPTELVACRDKFMTKVEMLEDVVHDLDPGGVGHWLWTGSVTNGYPYFYAKGYRLPACQFIWRISVSAIPRDLIARPYCTERLCVSPAHIMLHRKPGYARLLTEKQKRLIVERYHGIRGERPTMISTLALEHDVSQAFISEVIRVYPMYGD